MARFDDYATRYRHIAMERRNGILQITLHSDGDSLRWGLGPHEELARAFADIGGDRDNEIVIMTGTGAEFSGPRASPATRSPAHGVTAQKWDEIYWDGKRLLMNLLDIEVPMISAINGPAWRHSELPLLCDIVLAAEETSFQDSAHFQGGLVPGDGVHVIYPLIMGLNRGRYFLLTGQTLGAHEARDAGLVNEVLPQGEVLPRAWTLAEQLLQQPALVRRYSRVMLTQYVKRAMHDLLGYGLALEGLAILGAGEDTTA